METANVCAARTMGAVKGCMMGDECDVKTANVCAARIMGVAKVGA